jgi:hypothetical protein
MGIEGLGLVLCLILTSISFASSILTLILVYKLSKWNGYLQLVVSLSVCQLIYELGFFALPWYDTYTGRIVFGVLNFFGGYNQAGSANFFNSILL